MNTDQLLVSTYAPLRLSVGTRLRAGTVVACVGGGVTGYVYRVLDERGSPIAVREYFPPALATRLHDQICPQPQHEAAFEAGLKLFDEDGWQMAAHEHPGLLKVQHIWSERGTSYQAMPWCEGRTLDRVVRASNLPPSQAQLGHWLRAMADALAPIHRRHGVHGHLSPAQVMRLDSGRLLLMEFSRTRRLVAPDPRDIERNPYAALECGSDTRYGPMGPWTDVYALAAIVYFALRGRAPQAPVRRTPYDAQEPLAQGAIGDCSEDFLQGIDAGLALRPRARPRDLTAFLARLGLHERRSRPRTAGESLLVNLHLNDTAAAPDAPIDAAAESEAAIVIEAASAAPATPIVVELEGEPAAATPAWAQVDIDSPAPREPARRGPALLAFGLLGIGAVAAVIALGLASFEGSMVALSVPAPATPAVSAPAPSATPAPDAAVAAASSPIPDPLEPTAAGTAMPQPAEPPAPSPQADEPVTPPPEAVAVTPPSPAAKPAGAKAKPSTPPPAEMPVDTVAPTSPCPDLLARQYIGRRLDAAERAQMEAQCR